VSQDPDVLDPVARALLAEVEPPDCAIPDHLRNQMRARMDLALVASAGPGGPAQPPPAQAPSSPAPAPAAPARPAVPWRFLTPAASAIMGATVATLVLKAVSTPDVVYVDRPVPMSPIDAAPPAASAPVVPPAATNAAPAPPPPPPSAPRGSASQAAEADDPLVVETRLIDTARAALARGDFTASLAAVDLHAKRFPSGRLAEEREALAVQALVGAHRDDEARARGERFHQRFPASLLKDTVDSALSTIP
jgi:hypothetical protein